MQLSSRLAIFSVALFGVSMLTQGSCGGHPPVSSEPTVGKGDPVLPLADRTRERAPEHRAMDGGEGAGGTAPR